MVKTFWKSSPQLRNKNPGLELGMNNLGLCTNRVCSNYFPVLTFDLFVEGANSWYLIHWHRKLHISSGKILEIYWKTLASDDQSVRVFPLMPKFILEENSWPFPRANTCIKLWKNTYRIRVQREEIFVTLGMHVLSDRIGCLQKSNFSRATMGHQFCTAADFKSVTFFHIIFSAMSVSYLYIPAWSRETWNSLPKQCQLPWYCVL